jgi:spermidine synthase
MKPWKRVDTARLPGGDVLYLYRRGDEFSIRGDGFELMNSRVHGSEEALGRLACQRLRGRPRAQVLIGGLGMGYTLAAALQALDAGCRITVAELVPAVVRWNQAPLAHLAGHPLADNRVTICETDVLLAMRSVTALYDAVILDVDNGPDGLTRRENDRLYGVSGLKAAAAALRPGGVLAVWSAAPDARFTARLRRTGFAVDVQRVAADGRRGNGRAVIWLAHRDPE